VNLTRANCDSFAFIFNRDILPIFNSNCNFAECHATSGDGAYDLTEYSVAKQRVESGTLEYRLDLPYDDPQHMPQKMRLSECDYFKIKTWIRQGYPEK
jgi:hypothetical protein